MTTIAMTPMENAVYQFFTWTCVAACVVLKVPQLANVLRTSSARGLSSFGLMLEMWSFGAMMAYCFAEKIPLLQYLDYVLLMFTEVPLFFLVLHYNRHINVWSIIYCITYCLLFGFVASGYSTPAFNAVLINTNTPISATSKLTQLFTIIRDKSAGSVSATTWSLAAYSCLARIFTLKLEFANPDIFLMAQNTIAGTLNTAVFLACIYYGPGEEPSPTTTTTTVRDRSPSPSGGRPVPRRSPRKAD